MKMDDAQATAEDGPVYPSGLWLFDGKPVEAAQIVYKLLPFWLGYATGLATALLVAFMIWEAG